MTKKLTKKERLLSKEYGNTKYNKGNEIIVLKVFYTLLKNKEILANTQKNKKITTKELEEMVLSEIENRQALIEKIDKKHLDLILRIEKESDRERIKEIHTANRKKSRWFKGVLH